MQIAIKDVKVKDRIRKSFSGIEALAESIKAHGQIQPIVIDEDNTLIAGERRLRAHRLLGKETIEAIYMKDLDSVHKKEIELEENLNRENFTWQEEVVAKAEIHNLKKTLHSTSEFKDEKWGMRETAEALGQSLGSVAMDIQLANGLAAFPELVKEKNKATAYKIMKREQKRILEIEIAKRISNSKAIAHPDIILGNCIDQMQKMEAESVDLILTDPPYGIDVDEAKEFRKMDTRFNDSDFDTYDLLDKALKEFYRVLKNNRHCYIFFAIDKYSAIMKLIIKHGFEVHPIPLIWDKGSGSYPSQMTTYVHSYEPFLHCWKGDRKLNGTPRDIFAVKRVPSASKVHPTQKPTELLRDLIGFSSSPGELVFDPFAGSGATLIAARETQRRGLGIELNPIYYKAICERLSGSNEQPVEEKVPVDTDMEIDTEGLE